MNYLSIHHNWPLCFCRDFTVNRLSGPIPVYLGNMTSLLSLWVNVSHALANDMSILALKVFDVILFNPLLTFRSLESNEFTGKIPPELGNLSNLTKLYEISKICFHQTDQSYNPSCSFIYCAVFWMQITSRGSCHRNSIIWRNSNNCGCIVRLYTLPLQPTQYNEDWCMFPFFCCRGLTSNNLTGKLPNFQSWPELVEVWVQSIYA